MCLTVMLKLYSCSFVRLPKVSFLRPPRKSVIYLFLFILYFFPDMFLKKILFHRRIITLSQVSVNEWRNVWWRFIESKEVQCA